MHQRNLSVSVPQPALDVHQIAVTFFDDKFAFVKYEDRLTLPDLAEEIRTLTDTSKKKLPWLKLAQFGDTPSPKGCLRTNENLLEITGVEVDYDAGETTFDQAVERLAAAGLRALVYTSASHKAGVREKWRVLCPLSAPLPPDVRYGLVAELNGVLGGGIDPASFNLSIAFYYGSVNDNPGHRVEVLDGDFINLRGDLYDARIGKPAAVKRETLPINQNSPPTNESPAYSDADLDAMLDKSQYRNSDGSGNWHPNMTSVTASLVCRGEGNTAICERCGPKCDGGADDPELLALIESARVKFGMPDPDIPANIKLGPEVAAAIARDAPEAVAAAELPPAGSRHEDYYAFLPSHEYIYRRTGRLYPLASINATLDKVTVGAKPKKQTKKQIADGDKPEVVAVQIPASLWLDRNRPIMEMTWSPGDGEIIDGRLPSEGGWVHQPGVQTFNLYRPPHQMPGDVTRAGRWIDHVERLYGDDALHLIKWLAFKVQFPGIKINHMVVMGGAPGIGKDTLLEPVKHAVGPWNMAEISPKDMLGRFNGYAQSVILRISEARDLGDMSRYEFYERTKVYGAAPPDVLMVDEKNLKKYAIPNVCGTVITTNYKTNGIYLPADDRRHFVAWCDLTKEAFPEGYWPALWGWYEAGGIGHVAAYLASLNLSDFDPKAPLTLAFHDIVAANSSPEDAEMADAIDKLGNPDAVTVDQIRNAISGDFASWLKEPKNRRLLPYRFEQCGYSRVASPTNKKQGLWVVGGVRQAIYAKADLTLRERLIAASELVQIADTAAAALAEALKEFKNKKGI
jgi:hypothetical protein